MEDRKEFLESLGVTMEECGLRALVRYSTSTQKERGRAECRQAKGRWAEAVVWCCGGLCRATYELLGLQTYFTTGPKETRAWTIRKGFTAPQAAGVIHSDFER